MGFETYSGGGGFLKAAEHANDLVILVEPQEVLKDQEHEYEGVKGIRDEAVIDFAFFKTSRDVETATPSEVQLGVRVTNVALVNAVKEGKVKIDNAYPLIIKKSKRSWVWGKPDYPGALDAAKAYYDSRESGSDDDDTFPLDD